MVKEIHAFLVDVEVDQNRGDIDDLFHHLANRSQLCCRLQSNSFAWLKDDVSSPWVNLP
jgi:hypothetical protein